MSLNSWETLFATHGVSDDAIVARIFERHRSQIDVQKESVALVNLAKILKAALELSNKGGFHAMSMRDLARTADMSMGRLYSYVDQKPTLLTMIVAEVLETTIWLLGRAPDTVTTDPRNHLHWMIEAHIRLSEHMMPWFAFVYLEAKSFPKKEQVQALKAEEHSTQLFADLLERGMNQNVFSLGDSGLRASLIKPLLQEWYVKRGKYRRRRVSIEMYIENVLQLIDYGLGFQMVDEFDATPRLSEGTL